MKVTRAKALRNGLLAHAQEGYGSWVCVYVCVCVSVKSHLICSENTVTYSAGNGGQKNCGVFSETASLQIIWA